MGQYMPHGRCQLSPVSAPSHAPHPFISLQVRPDPYRLPPLSGLAVCMTGFLQDPIREGLPGIIASLGGSHFKDMHRGRCTHLVASDASGPKFT